MNLMPQANTTPSSPIRMRLRALVRSWVYALIASGMGSRANRAVILMYHSVGFNPLRSTVAPDAFDAQMKYLKEGGFNVVSLDALADLRAKGSIPSKTVAITFDDGYKDNYTNALPILRKYGFSATVFLLTSGIGGKRDMRGTSMDILSESELRLLHEEGVALGAHSVTHPRFTEISETQAREEAAKSKEMIERAIGVSCMHFAYPHGRYDVAAARAVKEAGFMDACTTEDGFVRPGSPAYALPRNAIISTTTLADFRAIARIGRLSFARLRRRKSL